jgi:hypothetical protein
MFSWEILTGFYKTAPSEWFTDVLFLPTRFLKANTAFREFVLTYAWNQSRFLRQSAFTKERMVEELAAIKGAPAILHENFLLTAKLFYLEEAASGRVPLYSFASQDGPAGPFKVLSGLAQNKLAPSHGTITTQVPLIVGPSFLPEWTASGGLMSLSMPHVSSAASMPPEKFRTWTKAFERMSTSLRQTNVWRAYSSLQQEFFAALHKFQIDGYVQPPSVKRKTQSGTRVSEPKDSVDRLPLLPTGFKLPRRRCPFFKAVLLVREPASSQATP